MSNTRWRVALAACIAAVILCAGFVDRPVAGYMHVHLYGDAVFSFASRALGLTVGVLIAALAILIGAGIAALSGRRFGPWARTPIVCSLSAFAALGLALALKYAIGRSQVYPTYLVDHVVAFRPFSGVEDFMAFPSATTATAAAIAAVIWIQAPRFRAESALALAGVAFAIIVTNGHWLSDVIAGAFLGAWTGAMMARRSSR